MTEGRVFVYGEPEQSINTTKADKDLTWRTEYSKVRVATMSLKKGDKELSIEVQLPLQEGDREWIAGLFDML